MNRKAAQAITLIHMLGGGPPRPARSRAREATPKHIVDDAKARAQAKRERKIERAVTPGMSTAALRRMAEAHGVALQEEQFAKLVAEIRQRFREAWPEIAKLEDAGVLAKIPMPEHARKALAEFDDDERA